jgi:hypothetical protein
LKICSKCKAVKVDQELCNDCISENKKQRRNINLMYRYGITSEEKNTRIAQQNNACAICKNLFVGVLDTHLDHCHTTKTIRGILCRACNIGLGKFNDSPILLQRAIHYIEYYAKQDGLTSVPERSSNKSKDNTPPRVIHGTWPRENSNGSDDYRGEPQGQDTDSGTQESSGVSMGSGVAEVESFEGYESLKMYGLSDEQIRSLIQANGYHDSQSREPSVAFGTGVQLQLFDHR